LLLVSDSFSPHGVQPFVKTFTRWRADCTQFLTEAPYVGVCGVGQDVYALWSEVGVGADLHGVRWSLLLLLPLLLPLPLPLLPSFFTCVFVLSNEWPILALTCSKKRHEDEGNDDDHVCAWCAHSEIAEPDRSGAVDQNVWRFDIPVVIVASEGV
jgi:hypothetical protein